MNSETKEGSIVVVDLDGPNYHLRKVPLPPGRWNVFRSATGRRSTRGSASGAVDAPPDPSTSRGRYEALVQEHEKAGKVYNQAIRQAKTPEERSKAYDEKFPQARAYVGRFLQIAESAPDDPSAVDALVWIVEHGQCGPAFDRAIDVLARDHAADRRVGLRAASGLIHKMSPETERLLRAMLDKNPNRFVRGTACLWLGTTTQVSVRCSAERP